jgi:hypothetical protein
MGFADKSWLLWTGKTGIVIFNNFNRGVCPQLVPKHLGYDWKVEANELPPGIGNVAVFGLDNGNVPSRNVNNESIGLTPSSRREGIVDKPRTRNVDAFVRLSQVLVRLRLVLDPEALS